MGSFYFFTDIDLLQVQTVAQSFGEKGTFNGIDVFQVTSRHNAVIDPTAYAVCEGIVFIQQDTTNPNLVNLILKPHYQPDFTFPKVKFFIYRGIKKETLIDGSEIANRNSNQLTESIWASQDAMNDTLGTEDNPPAQALGTDIVAPTYNDTMSIESIFYRTNISHQFPQVKEGWSIGTFNASDFGFEIMVESIGFEPTLQKIRNGNNIIEVSMLSSTPTQPEEFEHWHEKEVILNYIDPCAFWGGFFLHKLKVKSSNGNMDVKDGNDLYDDVLVKFYNKNKIYLDIRNEYNFSFNYFKNYGTNIRLSFDETSPLSDVNYYGNGWCLLEIENGSFPANNTNSDKNTFQIAMSDGSGDNPLPMMYVSTGCLSGDYPREPKGKNRMIDLAVENGYTNTIKLAVPNRKGLANTTAVSSYIRLKYCKRIDHEALTPPVSSGTVIRASNYLDNIFPLDMKIFWSGDESIKSTIYNEEVYVDAQSIVGSDFIGSVGIARDMTNYNFIFIPTILRNKGNRCTLTKPFSISSETNSVSVDFFESIALKFDSNLRKSQFEFPTNNIEYIEFTANGLPNTEFDVPDLENTIIGIVIDQNADWNELQTLVENNFITKYRVYIGITNMMNIMDNNGYVCKSYNLVLRGYALNNGNIQVKEVNTTIKINSNGNL